MRRVVQVALTRITIAHNSRHESPFDLNARIGETLCPEDGTLAAPDEDMGLSLPRPAKDRKRPRRREPAARHYYATNARLRHYYGPTEIRFAVGECSLGSILVAGARRARARFCWGRSDSLVRDLQDRFPRARLVGGDAAFE
jgi:hypothetical protein